MTDPQTCDVAIVLQRIKQKLAYASWEWADELNGDLPLGAVFDIIDAEIAKAVTRETESSVFR